MRERVSTAERVYRRRYKLETGIAVPRCSYVAVLERDGLVCQICMQPVDPRSFHFDHIVPLRQGGTHTVDNIRVTHPACNMARVRTGGRTDTETALARAPARGDIPNPNPIPDPGLNADLPYGQISAQPTVLVAGEAVDPVGVFVDACRDLKLSDPDSRTKGRIGSEAKRLLGEGRPLELILEAIREVARRNCSPALLSTIAGDIERERKGIDTSRRRPTTNPVSQRIQSFSAFSDAEKSGKLP